MLSSKAITRLFMMIFFPWQVIYLINNWLEKPVNSWFNS